MILYKSLLSFLLVAVLSLLPVAQAQNKGLVGVSMPTKTSLRWIDDGNNMVKYLKELGYTTELVYAEDDIPNQLAQIENLITKGAKALVIASIDGTTLNEVLRVASSKGVKVVSYDRLIMNVKNVDYYTTFDNFQVGVLQGTSLAEALKLKEGKGPFNIELFGGSPDDNNAFFFYDGAMSVLKPYIDSGKLVIRSKQMGMDKIGTIRWDDQVAKARMDKLLPTYYATEKLDAVLSPNDTIAIGVLSSLRAVGYGSAQKPWPIITGQDADLPSIKSIIKGEQFSTVFKDTRVLAKVTAKMVDEILSGKTPEVTDKKTYNNGLGIIPSYLLKPVLVDKSNYKAVLVDSGYITEEKLTASSNVLATDSAAATATVASSGSDAKKITLGFAQVGAESEWRAANTVSIKDSAKTAGIELRFSEAQQKQENQIKAIRSYIAQKVNVIAFAPVVTTGWDAVLKEAKAAKIPVILTDRGIETTDPSLYVTMIGSDFTEEGRMAARWLIENYKAAGDVNIVELQGTVGSAPAIERKAGFEEVIKTQPRFKITRSKTADFTRTKGKEVMEAFLKADPTINVLYAHNDDMALGAIQAIEAAGKKPGKDIIIIGVDAVKGAFEAMIAGKMNVTVECNPQLGPQLMELVKKVAAGEKVDRRVVTKESVFPMETAAKELQRRSMADDKSAAASALPVAEAPSPAVVDDVAASTVATAASGSRKVTLGFAQVGAESEWRAANTVSIKDSAKMAGIELRFSEAQQKQENQIKAIRSYIAQKVNVIAFAPVVTTGWDAVLKEAKAAKIPVILTDRGIETTDPSLYVTMIGSDFTEEGRKAARWLLANYKTPGDVNIVELQGTVGSAPAIERKKGFEEVIKTDPRFKITRTQTGDFTRAKGKEVMEAFLKADPTINVLYAHNDDMAIGAIQAIEAAGKKPGKDIIIIGVDAVKGAFEAMIAGKMNVTVECNPQLGPQLMELVKKVAAGEKVERRVVTKEGVFPMETAAKEFGSRRY